MVQSNEILEAGISQEVSRIVGQYDFSPEVRVRPLSRSENIIYLVEDPGQDNKYVVRVNSGRLSYHNKPSIVSELEWLKAIRRDTEIVVPEVLTDRNSNLVHELNLPGSRRTRYASIYSFLPGEEPLEDDLPAGFRQLGEISARMHEHAKSWSPPDQFHRHTWSAEETLGDAFNIGHWKNGVEIEGETAELLRRAEAVVIRRTQSIPKDNSNFGLIHADLRLANLLVDGDRIGVIDFDDCGYGWNLCELPAALSFLEERADLNELIDSWLEGYCRISAISEELLTDLPTFMMLRRFLLLGWIGYQQAHLEFAREIGKSFTASSRTMASDYISKFG